MDPEEQVFEPQVEQDTQPEEVEVVVNPEPTEPDKEAEARRQLTARAKAAEAKARALEEQLKRKEAPLAVEDYIDISTSLDGLDAREKAFLAEQHKQSGKPLSEIRTGEDFQLWQSAYRTKLEKENALKPNATQASENQPRSLVERLQDASLAEKEEILKSVGLYKENRRRSDSVNIGNTRTR
jgi:hypothetical protein